MKPNLCVLIPVHNNPSGLLATCQSLASAAGDFDVVIVDDGSDPPLDVPEGAAGAHRICVHRIEKNRGICRALNEGLRFALEYDYIARLDSSDTVRADRFVRQAEYLDRRPACVVVGSSVEFVSVAGRLLFQYAPPHRAEQIRRSLRRENCIIHSAVMLRSDAVRRVDGYTGGMNVTEDYDLFLRLGAIGEIAIIPEPLTRCEYNYSGISVRRRRQQQWQRLKLQLAHFNHRLASSYHGVFRTLGALLAPHWMVLTWKVLTWKRTIPR